MRIRSPLTDDTIYGRVRSKRENARNGSQGQSTEANGIGRANRAPGRRLTRLIILLVLVLILMREAAKPEVYRNFFGALGAPLVAEPMPIEISQDQLQEMLAAESSNLATEIPEANDNSNSVPPRDSVDKFPRLDALVAELGAEGREMLTNWLAKVRIRERENNNSSDTESNANDNLTPDAELRNRLGSAAAGSGELDPEELNLLWDTPEQVLSSQGQELRKALQAALDLEYMSRVSDATIWSKADADAFYRWLEIGSGGELNQQPSPVYVGFVSLLDQPAVYRGSRVAMRGTAVRAEFLPAAANAFEIKDYWLIWVRPEDGSDRPVMAYTTSIPSELKQLSSSGVDEEGPEVLVDGVFLRRHLYQSQKGSELAPVIVGRVQSLATNNPSLADNLNSKTPSKVGSEVGKLATIAGIVALAFTLIVARYTTKTGRWRRQVRQRGLGNPIDFLNSSEHISGKRIPEDSNNRGVNLE